MRSLECLKVLKIFAHYISSLEFGHVRKLLASWFKISILQMTLYLMWRRGVSPKLFSPFGVWTKIEKYLSGAATEFLIQTNWVYPHYYDFSTKRLTDALGINECTTRAIELRNKRGFFHPKMCPLNKTFWDIFSKYFVLFF